jgi:surface polysaccharide O-acyltransferase-like enzyme
VKQDRRASVAWLFRTWMLMFWIPAVASAAIGAFALANGTVVRPAPFVLWFLASLLLQFASEPLSIAWTVGLVAQSALAIYVSIRLKLEA